MRYKRSVTPGTGSLVVGSRTDSLLAKLRSHPEDPEVLRELTMVAAGERDFPSLLQTYETLSESDREFDPFALFSLLMEFLLYHPAPSTRVALPSRHPRWLVGLQKAGKIPVPCANHTHPA